MVVKGVREESGYIFFHGHDCVLSNFYNHRIVWEGKEFCNGEQLLVYMKCDLFGGGDDLLRQVLGCGNALHARAIGRTVSGYSVEVWNKWKRGFMVEVLRARFVGDFAKHLLRYSSGEFVSADIHDRIWGIGMSMYDYQVTDSSSWRGKNLLGSCMTQVRDELL